MCFDKIDQTEGETDSLCCLNLRLLRWLEWGFVSFKKHLPGRGKETNGLWMDCPESGLRLSPSREEEIAAAPSAGKEPEMLLLGFSPSSPPSSLGLWAAATVEIMNALSPVQSAPFRAGRCLQVCLCVDRKAFEDRKRQLEGNGPNC